MFDGKTFMCARELILRTFLTWTFSPLNFLSMSIRLLPRVSMTKAIVKTRKAAHRKLKSQNAPWRPSTSFMSTKVLVTMNVQVQLKDVAIDAACPLTLAEKEMFSQFSSFNYQNSPFKTNIPTVQTTDEVF